MNHESQNELMSEADAQCHDGRRTILDTTRVAACLCGLAVAMVSCATPALYDATNPHEFVRLSKTNVSTNDLASNGIEYRVDDSTYDIYVPKSQMHKFGDYTIRVLATPVTVVLDAVGGTAIVCGVVILGGLADELEDQGSIIIYPAEDGNLYNPWE